MIALVVLVALAATAAAGLRWLRVAQREHYLPGSVTRFALRWWTLGPNRVLLVAPLLATVLSAGAPLAAVVGCLAVATGPFGLTLRGRTAPLVWTRRLRTLAGVWVVLQLLVVAAGVLLQLAAPVAVLATLAVPVLVDLALALTRPLEDRLTRPFVERAAARLRQVQPTVVAITGSYGKTSTKGYVAHLVGGSRQVVPTPRSFNNRAGLARAINEHLAPGTEVFVAEMGTYGPGEIAEMCAWVPPDIAVITAIGPVHLERMKDEETITAAKSEILERAPTAVLNVDSPWLAKLAVTAATGGKRVVRCSAQDPSADVSVISGVVSRGEQPIGTVDEGAVQPTNVACAVAVALEVGVPSEVVGARLASLPAAEHRATVETGAGGFTIVDDTYNSNPAGARSALAVLARCARPGHKQVLVTPGMVELGNRQVDENRALAVAAARQCTHLIVVGHTNRAALLAGAANGSAQVVTVETRDEAVAWVREHLGPGDAVLYENDLPDHYP